MFLTSQLKRGSARKRKWVNRLGRICQRCGYGQCIQALVLHHVYSSRKKFNLTDGGQKIGAFDNSIVGKTQEEIDRELNECVLLCSNCHAELHAGYWSLEEIIAPLLSPPEQYGLN